VFQPFFERKMKKTKMLSFVSQMLSNTFHMPAFVSNMPAFISEALPIVSYLLAINFRKTFTGVWETNGSMLILKGN